MAEDEKRRSEAAEAQDPDEAVMGAPPGRDPDFQLHSEVGDEMQRLASSPREEVRRLGSELSAGEAETTPLLAMSVMGIGAGVVVAIVIALVVLAIYLS